MMLADIVVVISAILLFGVYKVFQTNLSFKKKSLIAVALIFFLLLNATQLIIEAWLYITIPNFLFSVLFAIYMARKDRTLFYIFSAQIVFSLIMLILLILLYYNLSTMTGFGF